MPNAQTAIIREGVSAGLIGATVIAVWFALLDALNVGLLSTPIMLGTALATLFEANAAPGPAAAFMLYTVFHYTMFVAIGLTFAWAVSFAEEAPSAMIGILGLLVVFEVGWFGWTSVLARGFGELAWYQVFIANIIAAGCMGYYMYRQHPALPGRVSDILVASE